ncbi:hypothetical protein HPP92_002194 [Vanilla planifolia]|uniref:Uncharacterized protein n=1 Tax=Vanilla planifolia TaxID=51239 RepID=A0A835SDB4_VANPL|nr:hypothetical protein HPP92_002194 [Vanilla planifolia]
MNKMANLRPRNKTYLTLGEMDRLRPNSANSTPLSPLGFLERAAIVAGDRPSVVYDGKHHTWGETHVRCLRLASALSCHIRIYRGDVVRPWNSCVFRCSEFFFSRCLSLSLSLCFVGLRSGPEHAGDV